MPAAEGACLQRWGGRERAKEESVCPPHYFSIPNSFNLNLSHHVECFLNSLGCSAEFCFRSILVSGLASMQRPQRDKCTSNEIGLLLWVDWSQFGGSDSQPLAFVCLLAVIAGQPGQAFCPCLHLSWGRTSCRVWFEKTKSGQIWICLCLPGSVKKSLKMPFKFACRWNSHPTPSWWDHVLKDGDQPLVSSVCVRAVQEIAQFTPKGQFWL